MITRWALLLLLLGLYLWSNWFLNRRWNNFLGLYSDRFNIFYWWDCGSLLSRLNRRLCRGRPLVHGLGKGFLLLYSQILWYGLRRSPHVCLPCEPDVPWRRKINLFGRLFFCVHDERVRTQWLRERLIHLVFHFEVLLFLFYLPGRGFIAFDCWSNCFLLFSFAWNLFHSGFHFSFDNLFFFFYDYRFWFFLYDRLLYNLHGRSSCLYYNLGFFLSLDHLLFLGFWFYFLLHLDFLPHEALLFRRLLLIL